MRVPTSFSFLLGNTVSFTFSLFFLWSLLPTPPGVHQATVRGGAETVRDPAAAVVAGASTTSGKWEAPATLSAHVVSACALVAPVSPECLLPCRDLGDAAVTTGASCPARWPSACLDSLAAASGCVLRNARLSLHPFRSVSMSGAAPLCCCVILKAVGSMLECGHTVMCLHLANPACPVGLHIPSEGFCFGFLAGTLYIPSPAVCILDILVFYLIYC